MSIKIKDIDICSQCGNKDCSYTNAEIKANFFGVRTEETVCPNAVLIDGPLDKVKNSILVDQNCINCGLCAINCHSNNIDCDNLDFFNDDFKDLNRLQYNAIVCSYLNRIFGFSANTNRNKSLQFDGYVCTINGKEAFVQIDYNNDSLECARRLIGDFLLFSPSDRKIQNGIIVLNDFPRKGSNDIYNVLQAIMEFPTTYNFKFYFTTFKLLRFLALNINTAENLDFDDLLIDLTSDSSFHNLYLLLKKKMPDNIQVIRMLLGFL